MSVQHANLSSRCSVRCLVWPAAGAVGKFTKVIMVYHHGTWHKDEKLLRHITWAKPVIGPTEKKGNWQNHWESSFVDHKCLNKNVQCGPKQLIDRPTLLSITPEICTAALQEHLFILLCTSFLFNSCVVLRFKNLKTQHLEEAKLLTSCFLP